MRPRDWSDVREQMRPRLSAEVAEAFMHEYAESFYEGFKVIVCEHIDMYHEEFVEMRRQQRAQREAAARAAQGESRTEEPVAKGE